MDGTKKLFFVVKSKGTFLYQLKTWLAFHCDKDEILPLLAQVRHRQGRLPGRMEIDGFSLQAEATLQTLTLDVLKSNEIEGEMLDVDQGVTRRVEDGYRRFVHAPWDGKVYISRHLSLLLDNEIHAFLSRFNTEKKDWIMQVLFGIKQQGFKFELEGGTSLSKGFKIFNQFSEDIDVHIQPQIASGVNENPKNITDFGRP